jgi:hypothetical protein
MASTSSQADDTAPGPVEKAVAKGHGWLEPFARFGYVAKGFLYLLIGGLVALTSMNVQMGLKGAEANQRGVLDYLARQNFGSVLLIAVAAGLAGYSLWRLISAVVNAENKGVLNRLMAAASGITYAFLAFQATMVILGAKANSDDKGVARTLVDKPFGSTLLVLIGLVSIGVAIGEVWIGISGSFAKVFKLHEMKAWQKTTAIWLGRIGLCARALLFGLIGGFFVSAGLERDSKSAGGVTKALATMQHTVFGNWMLVAVCLGLVCYAGFMFFEARFRRIRLADPAVVAEQGG